MIESLIRSRIRSQIGPWIGSQNHGSDHGSNHGPDRGSDHRSDHGRIWSGSYHGSDHESDHGKITIKGSGKIQNFAEQKTFFKLSATIISNINCHKRSPHGIYRRNVWMETQKTKNTVNKDRKWWTYRNRASFSFFVFQDAPWRSSVKQVTALAFRDVSSLINCNAKCNNSFMKSRIESLIGRRRSDRRSDHGLDHGLDHWSYHGLDHGLDHGS